MRVRLDHRRLAGVLAQSRLSQNHWARRLGLDKGHLSQLVNGKRSYPSARTRDKLLQGLGLEFEDLFRLELEEDTPKTRPSSLGRDLRGPSRPALPNNDFPRVLQQKGVPMQGIVQDFRLAFRMLWKTPVFSIVTILVLALGLGANSAIFSVLKGVVLDPLPYPDDQRLVVIWETDRYRGTQREGASTPDYLDFQQRARLFENIAAFETVNRTVTGLNEPRRLSAARASVNYFETLGVAPLLGSSFTSEHATPGKDRVAVLHSSVWQSTFGGDPDIVGETIVLDGVPHEVVGVMPSEARLPGDSIQLWVPLAVTDTDMIRGRHSLLVVARTRQGITLDQAQQEMTAIMAALEEEYPEDNQARGAFVALLHEELVGNVRPALLLLMAAVGCVLLIVCVNVANLLLSRGASRQAEMAVRTALGASRGRIIRQMMAESLVLTSIGSLLGLGLAWAGSRLLLLLSPANLPRLENVALDLPVTLFALSLSLSTWLIFGMVPALRASRTDLQDSLKEGGRGAGEGLQRQRLKKSLVVAEVAVAVPLVIGAGLLLRSFWSLSSEDPGLQTQNILSLTLQLPESKYPAPDSWPFLKWPKVTQLQDRILEEVGTLPGVTSATLSISNPLSGAWTTRTRVVGKPIPDREGADEAYFQPVSESFFQTCGIPLRKGRFFTRQDDDAHPLVAIVNEAFADYYFGQEEPLGERILIYGAEREIVGVVGDVRFRGLAQSSYPAMYLPFRQNPMSGFSLAYRSQNEPESLLAAVKSIIWRIDPDLALFDIAVLDETLSASLSRQRFTMTLLFCFALAALLLSALGLYGVVTFLVAQRTREIGIRMALGADRSEVFRLVVGSGMLLVVVGVAIGVAAAFGSTALISSLLYGIGARDPLTFFTVPLVLVLVALLACYLPARRASRVEPVTALRYE